MREGKRWDLPHTHDKWKSETPILPSHGNAKQSPECGYSLPTLEPSRIHIQYMRGRSIAVDLAGSAVCPPAALLLHRQDHKQATDMDDAVEGPTCSLPFLKAKVALLGQRILPILRPTNPHYRGRAAYPPRTLVKAQDKSIRGLGNPIAQSYP